MASMPMKEPEAVPGMYTVEFTKERLGFRVMDCSEDEHKVRPCIIICRHVISSSPRRTRRPSHETTT